MESIQSIILAFVQGLTEFLPVSSSGHLILIPKLLGWEDQGLSFDVAVHLGSLMAVMVYFRVEISIILRDTFGNLFGGVSSEHSRLGWQLAAATIPVGLVGLLFGESIQSTLRDPTIIALAMIVFAVLLWWVDRRNPQNVSLSGIGWSSVALIACAQAIAIMPGVSRSGMTIAAALLVGLNRDAAARFSFLLAIPVILLASGFKVAELLQAEVSVNWSNLALGGAVSFAVALACIHWFLGFIRRFTMLPFVLYLISLAALILWVFR